MVLSYIKSSLAELRDFVELNSEANPSLSLDVSEDAFFETVINALQKLEHKCDVHALNMKDELKDQIQFSEDLIAEQQAHQAWEEENTVQLAC